MIDLVRLEAAMRELSSEASTSAKDCDKGQVLSDDLSAMIDQTTRVYSRAFLELQLKVQMDVAQRNGGRLIFFLVELDELDQLDNVNASDDELLALRNVAKCLSRMFRRGTDFIARIESQQFIVLTLSMSLEQAQAYLPAVKKRLSELALKRKPLSIKVAMTSYESSRTEKLSVKNVIDSMNF